MKLKSSFVGPTHCKELLIYNKELNNDKYITIWQRLINVFLKSLKNAAYIRKFKESSSC
jgi:hypothetical protein